MHFGQAKEDGGTPSNHIIQGAGDYMATSLLLHAGTGALQTKQLSCPMDASAINSRLLNFLYYMSNTPFALSNFHPLVQKVAPDSLVLLSWRGFGLWDYWWCGCEPACLWFSCAALFLPVKNFSGTKWMSGWGVKCNQIQCWMWHCHLSVWD